MQYHDNSTIIQLVVSEVSNIKNVENSISTKKPPWLILVGPTAVGKTAVAEQMALALKTDIVVADSRQIYQGMNIATNKPKPEALQKIKRHLINQVPPHIPFSAGAYKREAEAVIATLEKEGKPILIEGGTGLYIKALLYGLVPLDTTNAQATSAMANNPLPPVAVDQDKSVSWSLTETPLITETSEAILPATTWPVGAFTPAGGWDELMRVDPISAQKIHQKDVQKIARALRVYYQTGRTLSSFHAEHRFQSDPVPPFIMIGLRRDRATLYRRINTRVDQQFQEGLVEETKQWMGLSPLLPAMRALGYKQIIPYLQGVRTLNEAIEHVKRDTRHYAKRQMTWFSADQNIIWIDLKEGESPEETASRIQSLL